MARLIPITRKGKTVWVEDSPDRCPAGHDQLLPKWGPCPQCGFSMRYWQCRADGCELTVWDDEHRHRRLKVD